MLLNFTSHVFHTNEATNTKIKFNKCYCIFKKQNYNLFFANEGQKV